MNSRDKLILLADKLDQKGFLADAALIDKVIVKRSFDEAVSYTHLTLPTKA